MTLAHFAATRIDTPASFALAKLSDIVAVGRWALGSMEFIATSVPEVWQGRSLFDGSDCFVDIRAHPDLGLIDYHTGSMMQRLPRVSIRVSAGEDCGIGEAACMAAMTTWRVGHGNDEGWIRTCRAHDLEVLLFKAQIETTWNAAR